MTKAHYRITNNLFIATIHGLTFVAKNEKNELSGYEKKLWKTMLTLNKSDRGVFNFQILNIQFLFFLF